MIDSLIETTPEEKVMTQEEKVMTQVEKVMTQVEKVMTKTEAQEVTQEEEVMTKTAEAQEDYSYIKTIHVNLNVLSNQFKDEEFQAIFEEVGPITLARFVRRKNGRPRGFGFVQFESHELALEACRVMNNKKYGNLRMGVVLAQTNIDEKKPKEPKQKTKSPEKKESGEEEKVEEEEELKPSEVLFVGRLSWKCRRPQLVEIFEEFGEIKSCRVVPKGFAFVGFNDIETARKAMEAVNGTEIMGNEVMITWAKKKQPRKRKKKVAKKEEEQTEGGEENPEPQTKSKKKRRNRKKKAKRSPEKSAENAEEDVPGQDEKESPQEPKENTKKRVYFSNLPDGLETEELKTEVEKHGEVALCKVKKWRNGRTVAFVKMEKTEDAEKLVENASFMIQDTEATCVWARSSRRQ